MINFKFFILLFIIFSLNITPAAAQDNGSVDNQIENEVDADVPIPLLDPPHQSENPISDIEEFQKEIEANSSRISLLVRLGLTILIIVGQCLLIWLIRYLFKKLTIAAQSWGDKKLKPLKLKQYVLIDKKQMLSIMAFVIVVLKWLVTIFQLFITIPIIFSFYEPTKNLALTIFAYITTPLKRFALNIVAYIPNLFAIVIIIIIVRYLMRTLKFFARQIERGKLVLPGFYADWAQPTFNILRVLLYAFTVALIYPYLPNSESKIFQGVTVFVGIIFSISSSSFIGNLIAGIVMTYMRPFKVGDRIKLNDVTGWVVERSPMTLRLRTLKNEYVSFPNQTVLTTSVTNFSSSANAGDDGLILHAVITMGYDVPWRKVENILLLAAQKVQYVEKTPAPFVLQTGLDDFYAHYEINAYIKEIDKLLTAYSELYKNIQDGFTEAGISLFAPHYTVVKRADDI